MLFLYEGIVYLHFLGARIETTLGIIFVILLNVYMVYIADPLRRTRCGGKLKR
jgi:hypothetical protein